MKKLISITLAVGILLSVALTFGGCGDKDYPVEVANFVIDKEPESIVILDPSTADIVSFSKNDVKMVGRSDEVNQEWLSIVPSVGSATNPDIDAIKESGATIVFANSSLSENASESLKNNNIDVITMTQATSPKQLETNYVTLGKILGGEVTGSNEGAEAYNKLIDDMDTVKSTVTSTKKTDVLYTVCYLYLENNELKMMTSGTYGDMLLGYTGAVNAAVNIDDNSVDVRTLKIANPNFVFYADDATLQNVQGNPTLAQLSAVKNKKTLMVTNDEMSRQGQSALNTLQKMVEFMYPELAKANATTVAAANATTATTVAGATANTATTTATTPSGAAQPTTVAANTSVAADYEINLEKLSLKAEDDNNNVKAMQQRLFDLGYISDKENITGYYGEISAEAVSSFQKNNGIKETGTADNKTLVALFDSNAVKAQ